MKKLLLLITVVTLSTAVFSQHNNPIIKCKHSIESTLNTSAITPISLVKKHNTYTPVSTSNLVQLIDSTYSWSWNDTTSLYVLNNKYTNIVYDNNGNMLSGLGKILSNGVWLNASKHTSIFDVHNNEISYLSEEWNGSSWKNSYKYTTTYDANNNETSYTSQNWNGATWDTSFATLTTYDTNNNKLIRINENYSNGILTNKYQTTYTYNVNNIKAMEEQQIWTNGAWVNHLKNTFSYDANNNNIGEVNYNWTNNTWVTGLNITHTFDTNKNLLTSLRQYLGMNFDKVTYTYDADNNPIEYLNEIWTIGIWVNYFKHTYTYDANNQTSNLYVRWINNMWVKASKSSSIYDANNFIKEHDSIIWSGANIYYADSTIYYYHTGNVAILKSNATLTNIKLYPNPTTRVFTIETKDNATVQLFNLQGQVIANYTVTNNTQQIDVSAFNKGIYLLQVKTNNETSTQRLLVE